MIAADPWARLVISDADDRSDRRAVADTGGELVLGATAAEYAAHAAAQEKVRWIKSDLMGAAIDLSPGCSVGRPLVDTVAVKAARDASRVRNLPRPVTS